MEIYSSEATKFFNWPGKSRACKIQKPSSCNFSILPVEPSSNRVRLCLRATVHLCMVPALSLGTNGFTNTHSTYLAFINASLTELEEKNRAEF